MTGTDSPFEGDDISDDVRLPASSVAETLKMDPMVDLVAETLKMNPLNDLLQENSRLGKSVLESIRPSIDTSAWAGLVKASVLDTSVWSGLAKGPALDTAKLMGSFNPTLDTAKLMGSFNPTLDTAKLMGSFNPTLDTAKLMTQLHTHASFLPEDVLKQISSKIAFYNPKSLQATVQIAQADTEIGEAAALAVEEHLDELEEFVSTTTGHGLSEWKELKPSKKWNFAGATFAVLINTLEAGLTASSGGMMAAQMVSGLVVYLFFIAHLEADVRESRGVDEAGQ
ncbi:hypothetical protein [Corynebacterium callunae]|uniref:hypothetical protein n=1 Tax=Corynebacterium callunae TaxID=1721 RepID=UPI00034AB36D|nr:hypothetical protein [Corynebacterium callunae]